MFVSRLNTNKQKCVSLLKLFLKTRCRYKLDLQMKLSIILFCFYLLQQGFVDFYSRRDQSANDDNPWVKYGVLGAVGVVVLGALMTQRTWTKVQQQGTKNYSAAGPSSIRNQDWRCYWQGNWRPRTINLCLKWMLWLQSAIFHKDHAPFFTKVANTHPPFRFFYWVLKVTTKRNFVPHKKASKILQGANFFFSKFEIHWLSKWYDILNVVLWVWMLLMLLIGLSKECKACSTVINWDELMKRWSGYSMEK